MTFAKGGSLNTKKNAKKEEQGMGKIRDKYNTLPISLSIFKLYLMSEAKIVTIMVLRMGTQPLLKIQIKRHNKILVE